MDKRKSIFLRMMLIIGFLIFFYPNISDYVNSFTQSTGIVYYNKALGEFENIEIDRIKADADEYNKKIFEEKDAIYNPKLVPGYEKNLNPFNDGMMGSLSIEKIGVNLPVYHGVNEGVIQIGIGHLPGTSLPVGGLSTHSVLSTHSGLPSAKLFTDLHKLEKGDEFIISVLGYRMFYEVDQIETVLPREIELLKISEGKDYVTLFTCTPYGINTHRLLVRGHRIDKVERQAAEKIEEEARQSLSFSVLKLVLILGLILIIIITIIRDLIFIIREKTNKNSERRTS
ncbi:MAG: class C sortase [Lagierella massiliensis]|nr:class C sortase [Lagierella massiliensis]